MDIGIDCTPPVSLYTGDVLMIVPTPEGGRGRGWEDMGDGTMGAKMFRFLQRDIDEGRIYYKHKGSPIGNTDIFTFKVSSLSVNGFGDDLKIDGSLIIPFVRLLVSVVSDGVY